MSEKTEEPATKKLRSSEHDLKIIVRDKDESGNLVAEKEYNVYSVIYANHSKFIDTSLSINMREKETRVIILNGVNPDTFECAIKYLEDPVAIRKMTVKDALEVLEFYDKYEFTGGMAICDQVLSELFRAHKTVGGRTPKAAFDLLVEAAAAVYKFQLKKANTRGMKFVHENLCLFEPNKVMFTAEHLRKLLPMLMEQEFGKRCFNEMGLSKEEVESPLLPKFLVAHLFRIHTRDTLMTFTVTGTAGTVCDIDGKYDWTNDLEAEQRGPITLFGREAKVYFSRGNGFNEGVDWAIDVDFLDGDEPSAARLWESPHSRSLTFPTTSVWKSDITVLKDIKPKVTTTMTETFF